MPIKALEDYLGEAVAFSNDGDNMHFSAASMAAAGDMKGDDRVAAILTAQTFALWAVVERLEGLVERTPDA